MAKRETTPPIRQPGIVKSVPKAQTSQGLAPELTSQPEPHGALPQTGSDPAQSRARFFHQQRVRRWVRGGMVAALFFILSLLGSGVAVTLFGTRTYHWKAFDIEAGIQPSLRGETRLIFAPLGEVRARTHAMPVALNISLRGISFDAMKDLITSPPPRHVLEADFERTAKESLRDLAIRQIVLGAVGALCVPLIFRMKRARYWMLCALWGGGFVAIMFAGTIQSFNKKAFESPTYTGSLRQAEWIIALVKDGFNKVEALSDKLRHVADNLNVLYGRINAVPGLAADVDTIRILHISDIHNNRAAVGFVRDLAARLKVDAVIDTGDLTDFGTPLETQLTQGLAALKKPYLFVAGNHDSQATIQALRANPDVLILENAPVRVAGLVIYGAPDPSSSRAGAGSVDTSPEALRTAGEKMAAGIRSLSEPPDIVCVHDPEQGQPLLGLAPVLLCGHEHRAYIETKQNTIVCNAGTTGAAGARYFEQKQGVPFSAAILTFSRQPHPHLLFVDQVVLDGSLGQYSINRRTFNNANTTNNLNSANSGNMTPPLNTPGDAVHSGSSAPAAGPPDTTEERRQEVNPMRPSP